MDYDALLLLASDLGYGLLRSGAEIYRVEESIQRLLLAYGVAEADPFVIPNCIIVSFTTPEGTVKTQVRRITSAHGTDVERLERYNDFSRRLCAHPLPLAQARQELEAASDARSYTLPVILLSYFLGTALFSLFFGGTVRDGLAGGLCGLAVGLVMTGLTALHTNLFLKTMICSAVAALLAQALTCVGVAQHSDLAVIGAFMALVPGLMFTNAIRDVMAGDMVAGLSKLSDALLTGVSLAFGAALALSLARFLWPWVQVGASSSADPPLITVLYAFLGSGAFWALFNIRSLPGTLICALGGGLGWLTYLLAAPMGSDVAQTLLAALVISAYAELMARVRKCPVTGYQLLSLFPLVPGAGIYYTMVYALAGNVGDFLTSLLHVLGIAGALAVGVLMVSSAVHILTILRRRKGRDKL